MYLRMIYLTIFMLSLGLLNIYCGKSNANEDNKTAVDSSTVSDADSTQNGKKGKDNKKDHDRIPVEVATIKRGPISDFILLSTNLETEEMAAIYSRVQGLVKKIYVEEGDNVKKGQILMSLEADEYKLAEERANLNYLQQKTEFERLESMFNEDLLSKEEFEKARFSLKGLEVDWKQAKLNLSYATITSPISGVIGEGSRKLGDRIQPSDILFNVINTREMIAVVFVPEKELGSVEKNQLAYITSDHLRNERFEGWIKRVSPIIDPKSGTFKVTIGVTNKNNSLRAGMFVNTHIITNTHENALLIPKTAIVYENDRMNIFVVRDSVAQKISLKIGFQDHEKVEAIEDVNENDKVIVVGQAGLKDQTKVKIVSERENNYVLRMKDSKLSVN